MKTRIAALLLLTASLVPLSVQAEKRTFIDQTGRPLEGELVSAVGDTVTIKRASDGQTFTMKATNFSRADQDYFVSKGGTPAAAAPLNASAVKPAANVGSTAASLSPMRMELKVYPNKNDKQKNGYYDERVQRISYKIDVRNGEQQRGFDSGKMTIIAVAKNLQDADEAQVVVREEFPVSLKALDTQSVETKETKLTYDNLYFKYGFKYSGYVCVLKDQSGKTVTINGSTPALEKNIDELLKLKVGDVYNKSYKLVENQPLRSL